jgi:cell division protein FtsQ
MARRKNRRRSSDAARPRIPWPRPNWHRLLGFAVAGLVATAAYVSTVWLMNRPIDAIVVNAPFERVSAMELESVVTEQVAGGFFSIDLERIRDEVNGIPWVADATVQRRWPATVVVNVTEQVPAACWGERGLLNLQGELFVENASRLPAELPRLNGPAGSESRVAGLYLRIEKQLEQRGLTVSSLSLDDRGAWTFRLSNGVTVRLGGDALDQRLGRFFAAYDGVISARAAQVDYVDMRYTNGFAIGWKDGAMATEVVSAGVRPRV